MRLPFILFGQHTVYTYRAIEVLLEQGIFPLLLVVGLPPKIRKNSATRCNISSFPAGSVTFPA